MKGMASVVGHIMTPAPSWVASPRYIIFRADSSPRLIGCGAKRPPKRLRRPAPSPRIARPAPAPPVTALDMRISPAHRDGARLGLAIYRQRSHGRPPAINGQPWQASLRSYAG